MAKVLVKCLYCSKYFDRISEPCQKIGNRYAHQECYDRNYTESDMYKEKIFEFIKQLYGSNYKYQQIESQRKNFVKKGISNKEIYYALKYYFEVQNGSIEKSEGRIGIVPYVYEEAKEYYEKMNTIAKNLADSVQQNLKTKTINVETLNHKEKQNKAKIDMNSLL